MRPSLVSILVLWLTGCCFGDAAHGFTEALALQGECENVIQTANRVSARIEAMPDPLAGMAAPTPEQASASLEPMAAAYDQGAAEIGAVPVTVPALLTQRDALVALDRNMASILRAEAQAITSSGQTGDTTAVDSSIAQAQALPAQEEAILASLNALCSRR